MAGFRSTPSLIILLLSSLLNAQSEKVIDWPYEIDLLGKELASRHSNLYFHRDSSFFLRSLDQIAGHTTGQSIFDVSVMLQQVIARMGDPQTRINYHFKIDPSTILPIELYWFEEGIFVTECYKKHGQLLGKRIISINSYPLHQVIDSLSTLLTNGNRYQAMAEIPKLLTWTPLLMHFGFCQGMHVRLGYLDDQGVGDTLTLNLPDEATARISVEPASVIPGWRDRKEYFRDLYLPAERLYYIQYNKCWSREVEEIHGSGASALFMPSFKEFQKKVMQTIRKNQIDKLVIDLRFNDGGHPEQGTEFIKKLSRTRYKGAGRFYVITGRDTRGAALQNAVQFIEKTGAKVVGEPSGGKPNHFGEVKRFVLPETKLVVNYSTRYFQILPGDPPSLQPDLETPLSFKQYLEGTDPPLEAILREELQ